MTLQEEIQYHANIRTELPEILAELVNAGRKDDALNFLLQWGTRSRYISEIWKEAKDLLRSKED